MILRSHRDDLALSLRHLAAGLITNDEFDDTAVGLFDERDPAIEGVYWEAWCLYSDTREYRLRDRHALPRSTRRTVARAIVFLHSDLEFEWPVERPKLDVLAFGSMVGGAASLAVAAFAGSLAAFASAVLSAFVGWLVTPARWAGAGEPESDQTPPLALWPFACEVDLAEVVARPRLLCG